MALTRSFFGVMGGFKFLYDVIQCDISKNELKQMIWKHTLDTII